MNFELSFLEIARNSGMNAQISTYESKAVIKSYKTLTAETITQKSTEQYIVITLESSGSKVTKKFTSYEGIDASDVFVSMKPLLSFSTQDAAECLPEIRDSIEGNAQYFTEDAMNNWVEATYQKSFESLSKMTQSRSVAGANSSFDSLAIEALNVGASFGKKSFYTTFGAKKIVFNSQANILIGFNGMLGSESNAEWLGKSHQCLFEYDEDWTIECAKRLHDSLQPKTGKFTNGPQRVAFDYGIAGEITEEFLGLLSGYAISENMTPFKREEIGSQIMPEGVTIRSIAHGKDLGTSQFFDGNGITSEDITIIRDGRLESIFLNKASAERLGLIPNGQPGSINVVLNGGGNLGGNLSGEKEKKQGTGSNRLVANTGTTFLCTNLSGMHTMDSATGDFALEGEGYEMLPNGDLGSYIKHVGVSGNIRSAFASLVGHGNDFPEFGTTRIPTLIIDGITLNQALED